MSKLKLYRYHCGDCYEDLTDENTMFVDGKKYCVKCGTKILRDRENKNETMVSVQ